MSEILDGPMDDDTKPCCVCGKQLENAMPTGNWDCMQPWGGGEVIMHFAFGSHKFDHHVSGTCFNGVICDECAEGMMDRLEDISEGDDAN